MVNFKNYMASVHKEAGRQGVQFLSVKSIFLRIELKYVVSWYIRLFSPKIHANLKKNKKVRKYLRRGFFTHPLETRKSCSRKTPFGRKRPSRCRSCKRTNWIESLFASLMMFVSAVESAVLQVISRTHTASNYTHMCML